MKVAVIMGSTSDYDIMSQAVSVLEDLGIEVIKKVIKKVIKTLKKGKCGWYFLSNCYVYVVYLLCERCVLAFFFYAKI